MLNDASGFDKVYIACGYSDLRRGIDGFASIIQKQYKLDPFKPGILFLFCGRKSDRIKGLLWEGDGFLLLSLVNNYSSRLNLTANNKGFLPFLFE